MIETPTVLILGAGASKPYGFPIGRELLDEICVNLNGKFWQRQWGRDFVELLPPLDKDVDLITEFRERLYRSSKGSVDAFLEANPDFVDVGKLAIAATLVPRETEKLIGQSRSQNSWYEYLFNNLDSNSSLESFGYNRLSILTYNYDRSLEEFLYTSLKNTYGCSDEITVRVLSGIPIVHLHGVLGSHPSQGDEPNLTRDYASDSYIPRAAEGIRIIHEVETSDDQFQSAYRLLAHAERICFLGFGYNPMNLRRLKLPSGSPHSYWGSAFEMGQAEIQTAKGLLPGRGDLMHIGPSNLDCLGFLREIFALR